MQIDTQPMLSQIMSMIFWSLQCYPVITFTETYVAEAKNLTSIHFQTYSDSTRHKKIVFINDCFDNFLNDACNLPKVLFGDIGKVTVLHIYVEKGNINPSHMNSMAEGNTEILISTIISRFNTTICRCHMRW